jgi:hypothetical protein
MDLVLCVTFVSRNSCGAYTPPVRCGSLLGFLSLLSAGATRQPHPLNALTLELLSLGHLIEGGGQNLVEPLLGECRRVAATHGAFPLLSSRLTPSTTGVFQVLVGSWAALYLQLSVV